MILYRLLKTKYATASARGALSSIGAQSVPGRWHSQGQPALYTASTPELALLETLVHLGSPARVHGFSLASILVPEELQITLLLDLPTDPVDCRAVGSALLDAGELFGFWVPSVIVPQSFNAVLNTEHPAFPGVTVMSLDPFPLDERLLPAGG